MNLPLNSIPPLENGDQLSRTEFECRYDAMPHLKKAELIEGVVYMASPLRFESHGKPHGLIMGWLSVYYAATPGIQFGDNVTVRLDKNNEYQPDAVLFIPKSHGGQVTISDDDYLEGAPELIVEIAASTASYDCHIKKQVYERCGVREYLIWRVYDKQFDWFSLQEGHYIEVQPNEQGLIDSRVFPGLVLAVTALLSGEYAQVLSELQRGLNSVDHNTLIAKLST